MDKYLIPRVNKLKLNARLYCHVALLLFNSTRVIFFSGNSSQTRLSSQKSPKCVKGNSSLIYIDSEDSDEVNYSPTKGMNNKY